MADTNYGIETYNVHDDGRADRKLQLEGWFFATQGVAGMQLALPGVAIPVGDFRQPSFDLIPRFGRAAERSRFRLETRFDAKLPPLEQGRLLILLANGDGMTIEIASMLTRSDGPPEIDHTEADRALASRFVGLGATREFSLVQRRLGDHRPTLLGHGARCEPAALAQAIQRDFAGFGTEDDLEMMPYGSIWVARSRRYGIEFQTSFLVEAVGKESTARFATSCQLVYLADRLRDELQEQGRIFVWRAGAPGTQGLDALAVALRARSQAKLLEVVRAAPGAPHGRVELVSGNLYRGTHGSLAPDADPEGYDTEAWLALLRRADAVMSGAAPAAVAAPAAAGPRGAGDDPAAAGRAADAGADDGYVPDSGLRETGHAETDSWRTLTSGEDADAAGAASPAQAPPPPAAEPAAEPETGGFWSRVLGRR